MRLINFKTKNGSRIGAVRGSEVVDLNAIDASIPATLAMCLEMGVTVDQLGDVAARGADENVLPLESITYDIPLSSPGKI